MTGGMTRHHRALLVLAEIEEYPLSSSRAFSNTAKDSERGPNKGRQARLSTGHDARQIIVRPERRLVRFPDHGERRTQPSEAIDRQFRRARDADRDQNQKRLRNRARLTIARTAAFAPWYRTTSPR